MRHCRQSPEHLNPCLRRLCLTRWPRHRKSPRQRAWSALLAEKLRRPGSGCSSPAVSQPGCSCCTLRGERCPPRTALYRCCSPPCTHSTQALALRRLVLPTKGLRTDRFRPGRSQRRTHSAQATTCPQSGSPRELSAPQAWTGCKRRSECSAMGSCLLVPGDCMCLLGHRGLSASGRSELAHRWPASQGTLRPSASILEPPSAHLRPDRPHRGLGLRT
mmetsp:Transcript_35615/g.85350  ORF Transcript_35615/g.85350 Transcript_35615/m.85350 type:complete len:218 (-) Transcript_35615:628-1281(-)